MKCDEFQRMLPEPEGIRNPEQEQHLRSCPQCAELVTDLTAIAQSALLLVEDEEPSPRVWNRLEIALRQEGLIREAPRPVPAAKISRWSRGWLVPLTASFLVIFGLLLYERGGIEPQTTQTMPGNSPTVAAVVQPEAMPADQADLLKIVATQAPGLQASYESELRAVNAYIRDAELSARRNPNDEISQQYLTNAYEQRAMVYEMAMDRGLP